MANAHRTNVLVTSCLKTPVDPHTKAPLASYERERVLPCTATSLMDNRDYDKELQYEDSGSDFCDEDYLGHGAPLMVTDYRATGDHLNLSEIFFSNEEYYSKLEELKKAHLRTMAELEDMYRRQLQLKAMEPLDTTMLEAGRHRLPWSNSSPAASRRLRKSHSAVELRRSSRQSDSSDEEEAVSNDVEKGLLFSPKEHIKNMWQDFKLPAHHRRMLSSSLQSLPADHKKPRKGKGKKRLVHKDEEQEDWKHRLTVPQPFQMMLREAERRKRGIKTRSEIEQENTELRRQLEELTECQRKFRASPVPAHVHLPLYEELQERHKERRRTREREDQHLRTSQKPFSFLERERIKKEQKQLHHPQQSDQEKVKPFKAKPVPKAVYAAASGEQMKEEQLYRAIKIQMRAQEMLTSASMPPSMLARRLSDRKKTKDGNSSGDDSFSHRPHINKEVPDFDASYRRFQKHLEKQKEVKPTTACEPFDLRTSHIASHRDRILADIEKEQSSPKMMRWPYVSPGSSRTPNSSLCSSLSGSLEILPTKVTDATKKRHEAVRKALEQRKKAEHEEERWKERQKQREKKLQRVVMKRAQANDPHLALSQTHQTKLKEFRKQELQRKKEYQQEIKEMKQRVKGRPLLLEQVAQRNAKQAAEKRYTDALHGCDLTEEFISSKAVKSRSANKASQSSDSRQSDQEEPDMGYKPVHYRKVFLDDDDTETDPDKRDSSRDEASLNHRDGGDSSSHRSDQDYHGENDDEHESDESYHYSDDHENYSDDSEHDADTMQQEAGQ
ncbi:protein FAM161A [Centropristis striata]|uniref:protein FAM161A n=1 Tax=Centropristis striata TaxID=184440 RepID=UPI0027E1CE44|nr:protein FAM161A [Centropristis striata]